MNVLCHEQILKKQIEEGERLLSRSLGKFGDWNLTDQGLGV